MMTGRWTKRWVGASAGRRPKARPAGPSARRLWPMLMAVCLGGGLPALPVAAEMPRPILPEQSLWQSPPRLPALTAAWLLGGEGVAGPYVVRVRLAADGRIPPHTHPDTRHVTVLAGTLYVGFGDTFALDGLVAVPAGALYVAPAGVRHYVWARDGAVEYQESGYGPSGTVLSPP